MQKIGLFQNDSLVMSTFAAQWCHCMVEENHSVWFSPNKYRAASQVLTLSFVLYNLTTNSSTFTIAFPDGGMFPNVESKWELSNYVFHVFFVLVPAK